MLLRFTYSRTLWLALSAVASALLISWTTAVSAVAGTPPNIVFIFADDWGWGDLACHGHPYLQTPNIDRLAKEGVDFAQFNVCNPVCSPSRTALMTGCFPARFSVHQHFAQHELNRQRGMPDWLDPKVVLLPRLLQQASYRTGHFGKWHLSHDSIPDAPRVQEYGFDESAVYCGPPPHATHETHLDAAIEFIKSARSRPFYVNVWLHETHLPHFPTKQSLAKYAHLNDQQRVYAAVIEEGDRKVGRILQTLQELRIDDSTIVVFSSDNGPESTGFDDKKELRGGLGAYYSVGETAGLRGRKRSLFEGGVRTSFIVRWPGHAPAGAKDETTVLSAVDILPTFCAAAAIELPSGFLPDGENMLPAFCGKPVARSKPIYWEWRGNANEPHWWPRSAMREGDWKLLVSPQVGREELYNLRMDAKEQMNLAESEPARTAKMTKSITTWLSTLPQSPPKDCVSKVRGTTSAQ